MYLEYLKYILDHKKNVFNECIAMSDTYHVDKKMKHRMIWHAFVHDLSKFRPSEFISYAKYFYGENGVKVAKQFNEPLKEICTYDMRIQYHMFLNCRGDFNRACNLHYIRNKHHPEYWAGREMPREYILEMICDLRAVSKKFGNTVQEYYLRNYYKWNLNPNTRYNLEMILGLLANTRYLVIYDYEEEIYMTLDRIIAMSDEHLKTNEDIAGYKTTEEYMNEFFKLINLKFNVNIYKLVSDAMKTKG